jgi:superfamily II DNA or RNA helicase
MDVTDPEALRLLMLLQACGADVRVYLAETGGFHLKAYLFTRRFEGGIASGTAFIGSSNISRQALTEGIEWNYRVEYPGDNGFLDVRECFDELFENWRAVALSDEWIDAYEKRRQPAARGETFLPSDKEPPPEPTAIQREALQALGNSRANGHRRGLVVLATGLGKTWLAAFDAEQMGARRVLFVAHREEILSQAADTFARIRPHSRVGFYMGQVRETAVDVLCASVQTLGKETHLERFRPDHFDYIVLDECHHAAAPTYRRLLGYFEPQFMLGLTATPDRTDQADILALCDDNLVFNRDLFTGIEAGLLAPFHYFGIWDETVDYREIPWRNGRFDPEQLTHKLATLGRARHALKEWRERAQTRTLAFCVSIRHAEFMAQKFQQAGISAAAVYGGSQMGRAEALQRLGSGQLQVVFAVDLFNEGVDLPAIDTVMLLRPTESRILFLQQLGRGLRRSPGKEQLVVLDFVGNHRTFIYKLQALMRVGPESTNVSDLMGELEHSHVSLPAGCFMNLDLALLDFVKSLHQTGDDGTYMALREALGRRPTLLEFFRSGASPVRVRKAYGHWFGLVAAQGDLPEAESLLVGAAQAFLRELETTALTKCFKLVLLEAFQDLDGWREPPALDALAHQSRRILERRRALRGDLPAHFWADVAGAGADWQQYWMQNPVNAWVGGNQKADGRAFFAVQEGRLVPQFRLESTLIPTFTELVQEVLDYRYASYEARKPSAQGAAITTTQTSGVRVAYFPNLAIACGHFRAGCTDAETYRQLGAGHGALDPNRHFIAQAAGHSMDGGERPIRDTDHLLLETLIETNLASLAGEVVVLEQGEKSEQKEYVLREVSMQADGNVSLRAFNPTYGNLPLTEGLRPVARLRAVLNRLDLAVGESFKREEIPPLFGETFNPGNWHSGHIVLKDQKVHVLLVTLNKQGKTEAHRYLDHWIDDNTFHWQSQQSTTPQSARGCEVIEHTQRGISLHLFTREHKINDGKAAPFVYHGKVRYLKHTGSQPMNVVFDVGGL